MMRSLWRKGTTRRRWHRQFAVDLFNRSRDLLGKAERSAEDETEMLGAVPDAADRSVVARQLLNLPEPPAQEE